MTVKCMDLNCVLAEKLFCEDENIQAKLENNCGLTALIGYRQDGNTSSEVNILSSDSFQLDKFFLGVGSVAV